MFEIAATPEYKEKTKRCFFFFSILGPVSMFFCFGKLYVLAFHSDTHCVSSLKTDLIQNFQQGDN